MNKKIGIALALVVALCLATWFKEPRFLQPQSIESILLWMPLITVVGMGQLLVILTGGIDISVGSILGFSGIAVGLILKSNADLALPWVFGAGLMIGGCLGLINAVLIAKAQLSPLIVTIGSLAGFRGLAFLLSRGDQIDSSMIPDSLTGLAHTGLGLGPVTASWLLLISLAVAGLTAVFLWRAPLGRNIFAYGSNREAARLRGISGDRVLIAVYSLSGALAGFAGVMYASRFGFVNPGSAGQGFELTVIAAVAIGGTKLTGGSGSVSGVLLGCLLLSCINVALSVLGIDANWQTLTYGVVIIVAILADGLANRGPS